MLLAFEPVTSHVYDLAREEYREGVFELGRFHDDANERSNLYCLRKHFKGCVSILNNLYYTSQVERIDELPNPETIRTLSRTQLESLSDKLRELYFPDVN
jgi:hypothetical protein